MAEWIERLPLRIAALAAFVVGAVSVVKGTDPWLCVERTGIAFVAFAVLGIALRTILRQGSDETSKVADRKGVHLNTATPEMSIDDLKKDVPLPFGRGDDNSR